MKKVVIGLMLLGGTSWGYQHQGILLRFSGGDHIKAANTAGALAKLREYQVAQNVYRQEGEEFAKRLLDLFEQTGRERRQPGYISTDLAQASNQWPQPIPHHGYLFADLTTHSNGNPVDRHDQYGLAAYPAKPGIGGDVLLLILQDDKIPRPEDHRIEMEGGGVTTGSHTIWARPFKAGDRPPTHWPSPQELARDYQRMDRSLDTGTREIREMFARSRQMATAGTRTKEDTRD